MCPDTHTFSHCVQMRIANFFVTVNLSDVNCCWSNQSNAISELDLTLLLYVPSPQGGRQCLLFLKLTPFNLLDIYESCRGGGSRKFYLNCGIYQIALCHIQVDSLKKIMFPVILKLSSLVVCKNL